MSFTIETQKAEGFYIRHEKYSWAQICINEKGDFHINSDWGNFSTVWRHFGDDFKKFLIGVNADYVIGYLESTTAMTVRTSRPFRMNKAQHEAIAVLFESFQEHLRDMSEKDIVEPVKQNA